MYEGCTTAESLFWTLRSNKGATSAHHETLIVRCIDKDLSIEELTQPARVTNSRIGSFATCSVNMLMQLRLLENSVYN